MGVKDHSTPPTEWCDWWNSVRQLTPDIAYGWPGENLVADPKDPNPWFWHWCSHQGRWMAQATPNHQLVSIEPLHLEPSLLWPCCGTHGFVRNGEWIGV
jgi:hypothetical protein